jgi:hypothetical protein
MSALGRQFRKICIRNKQQREQHSTNIEKISREGHPPLHLPRQGSIWQALIDYQAVNEEGRHRHVSGSPSYLAMQLDVWSFQHRSFRCTSLSYVAPRAAPYQEISSDLIISLMVKTPHAGLVKCSDARSSKV